MVNLISLLFTVSFHLSAVAADKKVSVPSNKPSQNQIAYEIDSQKSKLFWVGKKRYVSSSHNGKISIDSGNLVLKDNLPFSASIKVDMKTIECFDIKNPKYNKKLVSHLENEDFFYIDKYPHANLIVDKFIKKKNNLFQAIGKMTIRGKTHSIRFNFEYKNVGDKSLKANGSLSFDRNLFDVKYHSEVWYKNVVGAAKDKVIADQIDLRFEIIARNKSKLKI